MPTYQYACTNPDCGTRFELVQTFTDAAASECPVCGQPVRKVYGSVGVVFKGSGFYRTDSRAAASASAGAAESKSDSKSKSESKSDAKSESKSESKSSTPAKAEASKSAAATNGSGATKAAASA